MKKNKPYLTISEESFRSQIIVNLKFNSFRKYSSLRTEKEREEFIYNSESLNILIRSLLFRCNNEELKGLTLNYVFENYDLTKFKSTIKKVFDSELASYAKKHA